MLCMWTPLVNINLRCSEKDLYCFLIMERGCLEILEKASEKLRYQKIHPTHLTAKGYY